MKTLRFLLIFPIAILLLGSASWADTDDDFFEEEVFFEEELTEEILSDQSLDKDNNKGYIFRTSAASPVSPVPHKGMTLPATGQALPQVATQPTTPALPSQVPATESEDLIGQILENIDAAPEPAAVIEPALTVPEEQPLDVEEVLPPAIEEVPDIAPEIEDLEVPEPVESEAPPVSIAPDALTEEALVLLKDMEKSLTTLPAPEPAAPFQTAEDTAELQKRLEVTTAPEETTVEVPVVEVQPVVAPEVAETTPVVPVVPIEPTAPEVVAEPVVEPEAVQVPVEPKAQAVEPVVEQPLEKATEPAEETVALTVVEEAIPAQVQPEIEVQTELEPVLEKSEETKMAPEASEPIASEVAPAPQPDLAEVSNVTLGMLTTLQKSEASHLPQDPIIEQEPEVEGPVGFEEPEAAPDLPETPIEPIELEEVAGLDLFQDERLLFDDILPLQSSIDDAWVWNQTQVFYGAQSHTHVPAAGWQEHSISFAPIPVTINDMVVQRVWLESKLPAQGIALQFHLESGQKVGVYWEGEEEVFKINGQQELWYYGALPEADQWVELPVLIEDMNIEGQSITGMTFITHSGRVYWDTTTLRNAPADAGSSVYDEIQLPKKPL